MKLKKLTDEELMEKIKQAPFWVWYNLIFYLVNLFTGLWSVYLHIECGISMLFPLTFFFMALLHLILIVGFGIERENLINRLENRENTKLLGFNIIQKMDRMTWKK
jgi:hypothetical protein